MELYINTTKNNSKKIELKLKRKNRVIAVKEIEAKQSQAEKLLAGINSFLSQRKVGLKDLTKIYVKNKKGSFTALRIGVVTANALGYALGIKTSTLDKKYVKELKNITIVQPKYEKEPNITVKKGNT